MSPGNEQSQCGRGFHTVRTGIDPGDPIFVPGLLDCRDMEEFLIQGRDIILPRNSGTSLSRGATLNTRWLHEPQPLSDHTVGLRCSHRAERYRPGGSLFSSPFCWNCRDMEGVLIQVWDLTFPGCDWTSTLSRGASLDARWLHQP